MNIDTSSTTIGILLTTCNKYEPGKQVFRLQSMVGLKSNSTSISSVNLTKDNLLNADKSSIPIGDAHMASTIKLEVPFEVSRRYPTKFIPPGTRFIIGFTSGDITKPVVIGGEFQ